MSTLRSANLASTFQEVLTAIVRVRFRLQNVQDAEVFRLQIRQSLQAPMQQARALGYTGESVQAAVFAVIALLDESVLNLQDAAFANWARKPLQEELFGGHLAGETFFHNLRGYLARSDSPQLADVLELHCLCILLGYRGRYALGDSGDLYAMLRQARDRINRIRGSTNLLSTGDTQSRTARPFNRWGRYLLWTTYALACILALTFIGYQLALSSEVSTLQSLVMKTS